MCAQMPALLAAPLATQQGDGGGNKGGADVCPNASVSRVAGCFVEMEGNREMRLVATHLAINSIKSWYTFQVKMIQVVGAPVPLPPKFARPAPGAGAGAGSAAPAPTSDEVTSALQSPPPVCLPGGGMGGGGLHRQQEGFGRALSVSILIIRVVLQVLLPYYMV